MRNTQHPLTKTTPMAAASNTAHSRPAFFNILYLFDVIHQAEQAVPTHMTVEPSAIFIQRKPNEYRLTHNVILGNKTPIT